jgi:hypothetical protein
MAEEADFKAQEDAEELKRQRIEGESHPFPCRLIIDEPSSQTSD